MGKPVTKGIRTPSPVRTAGHRQGTTRVGRGRTGPQISPRKMQDNVPNGVVPLLRMFLTEMGRMLQESVRPTGFTCRGCACRKPGPQVSPRVSLVH